MKSDTFYQALRYKERDGLLYGSKTHSSAGPARRVYTITDAGEAYLEFWAEALEQYRRNMDLFFRLYSGVPTRKDRQEDDG